MPEAVFQDPHVSRFGLPTHLSRLIQARADVSQPLPRTIDASGFPLNRSSFPVDAPAPVSAPGDSVQGCSGLTGGGAPSLQDAGRGHDDGP